MADGTPTIKGNGNILWGTGGFYTGAIVISGRVLKTSDKEIILDGAGFAAAIIYFNMREEGEFELIVETSVPDLEIGDFITIDGGTGFMVDDTELMAEQRGAKKFRVRATKYSQITS